MHVEKYGDWYYAVKSAGLVIVNFCVFDTNSNFYGKYTWPCKGGFIMAKPTPYIPEEIRLDVTAIADISRIWVMNPDSSNIKHAAYDFLNEHLYLTFHSKEDDERPTIYRYPEVPIEYWVGMTQAESVGAYFQKTKKLLVGYALIKLKKVKKK